MKVLLITDGGFYSEDRTLLERAEVDIYSWPYAYGIRLSDHEIVIADVQIEPKESHHRSFFGSAAEVGRLLQAGGVLFFLAGPQVLTGFKIESGLPREERSETNYCLLPDNLLSATGFNRSMSRHGTEFEVISKDSRWVEYFKSVKEYYMKIDGVERTPQGHEVTLSTKEGFIKSKVEVLARMRVTDEPIACMIQHGNGTVGIIPRSDKLAQSVPILRQIGEEQYRKNQEGLGTPPAERPNWWVKYRVEKHSKLEQEIRDLQAKISTAEEERARFERIVQCLFSVGRGLERSVTKIFQEFKWDIDDRTHTGEPIDYIIRPKGDQRRLLVILTGTDGYISADSKKFSQVLHALPQADLANDRIVLLANTLATEDPEKRRAKTNITTTALERLRMNQVCFMLVYDLYRLWVNFDQGKRSATEIFNMIFNTTGAFQHQPS